MRPDIVKSTGVLTSTAAIQYMSLNMAAADVKALFTPARVEGTADWGGVTGGHQQLRERFTVVLRQFTVQSLPVTWHNVRFLLTSDSQWACRLQQDQQLHTEQWFQGGNGAATFGSTSGMIDLTTSDVIYYRAYMHSLTTAKDVERYLLSNLQGRITFADHVSENEVSSAIMSYDSLWQCIYAQSGRFHGALARYYKQPLCIDDIATLATLRTIVAKAVAVDLIRAYAPIASQTQGTERYKEWADEVDQFLAKPPMLPGLEQVGSGGGTITLARG